MAKAADRIEQLNAEISALRVRVKAGDASETEKLRLRRLRLEADEIKLSLRANRQNESERKIETRKKAILGAWVIHSSKNEAMASIMKESLLPFLNERDHKFLEEWLSEVGVI